MPSPDETLITGIREVFQQNGWACETVPGIPVVETGFEAHHGRLHLHVQAYGAIGAVSVVAVSPTVVGSAAARAKTVELLMRANERINLGGFELRWDEGEILFRIGNVFPEGRIEPEVLSFLVEIAIVEMDRIAPCLALIATARPGELLLLAPEELLARSDLLPESGVKGAGDGAPG
ncbi:MAG: hypothetical protein KGS60_02395 [Verrucomicrobia bacterium]|nr:hypothetical protein [Verrucomicrobiota bacterium]